MAVDGHRREPQAGQSVTDSAQTGQVTDEQQHLNFSGVAEDIDNQVLLEMNRQQVTDASRRD